MAGLGYIVHLENLTQVQSCYKPIKHIYVCSFSCIELFASICVLSYASSHHLPLRVPLNSSV